eukprot:CAMPEP_0169125618 /NCGR_PEP_ID=MMETSP1015-20121227/34986_1 /TAXON_ID=342587 /ORGANISM="Karlodinium micrum, Strain CCMP2283" /LENGTH=63 /DNA_ID=CAMNT_0009189177 /DNA_START=373 /DNA_END=565 /DNA_ORIENTATION=-
MAALKPSLIAEAGEGARALNETSSTVKLAADWTGTVNEVANMRGEGGLEGRKNAPATFFHYEA